MGFDAPLSYDKAKKRFVSSFQEIIWNISVESLRVELRINVGFQLAYITAYEYWLFLCPHKINLGKMSSSIMVDVVK